MTSKNSKSRRRDKAAGARDCNDDGGDDDGTELSEAELQRFVSDAVLYVVSSAGRRSAMSSSSSSRAPIIRKGEVLKAVGLSGKKRDVQDSVMALAARNLVDVFGLKLMDLGDADSSVPRNTYVLVNCMPTSHPGGSSGVSGAADDDDEKCQSETGLLFVVLAAIFMNGGSLTDDVLDPFLVKLGLLPSDSNAGKGNPSGGDRRADCNHPVLGDVKALIRNIFCTRQQYIEMAKVLKAAMPSF